VGHVKAIVTASILSLTGKTTGDFVAQERIGQGGMATVYPARQLSVNREVAGDAGYVSVSKLIKDEVKSKVIAGSYGAVKAMEEAGIDPSSVMISNIDAEQLAQEYIKKGLFSGNRCKLPEQILPGLLSISSSGC